MKTRIDIIIHKRGLSLSGLTDMIASANGNGGGLTIENVEGWVIGSKMEFPMTRDKWHSLRVSDISLAISEDGGETFVATLTWVELHELQDGEAATGGANDPKTDGDDEQLPFGHVGEPHNKLPEGWEVQ